ncbi:MAG: C39 family peptidase [Chloroflexota bacterium]
MKRDIQFVVMAILVLIIVGSLLVALVSLSDSLGWGWQTLRARLQYAINPPQAVVFRPQASDTPAPDETPTARPAFTRTPTIDLSTPTLTPLPPTETPPPTLPPTPLPAQANLSGILHMYQMMNNCGPANLAMALTYWGWKGDQRDTAAILKPNKQDKNVMPYEMAEYVETQTDLQAVVRAAGDLPTLKALIASGFPVIVEKGFEGAGFDGWMGHYEVLSGFDDARGVFIAQDSYKGPDLPVPYDELLRQWRAFNYTYIVIYPPERRQAVLDILGLNAYDNFNNRAAEARAAAEIPALQGRDLFFALFNQGTARVALGDYTAAAASYDSAFANYALLPEDERPWRMLWYQTGPYFAYYYIGRYVDVAALATQTLDSMSDPILEESFYWRAKAEYALGDQDAATADYQQCVKVHTDFQPCVEELQKLGVEP